MGACLSDARPRCLLRPLRCISHSFCLVVTLQLHSLSGRKEKPILTQRFFFLKILLAEKNECPKPETVNGHFFPKLLCHRTKRSDSSFVVLLVAKKNMKLIFLFDAHSLRLSVRTLANTRTFEHTHLRFARTPTFDGRTHASHANTN